MIAKIRKKVKRILLKTFDNMIINRKRKWEIKKFKDPRRVPIWSSVTLTKEQENAIDKLYLENYGEKIPHIWHRHFTAFTGNFDANYFPELLFIPEFEYYMNINKAYMNAFYDKNVLPFFAECVNVTMPKCLLFANRGVYCDPNRRIISKEQAVSVLSGLGEVFVKPSVDSSSGRGCVLLDMQNGVDRISDMNAEAVLESLGENFVVQERLSCHESIANIYDKSVNTFRIITYRWKDQICHMPAIMRIGQGGSYLDNAHAGGMFIAIDDDGTLHDTAFTEFKKEFKEHPDTHLKFAGYKIPLFPEVLKAAYRMHEAIPQIGCINWDFTLNKEGTPVLIEANMKDGSIWLAEMAHGRGPFGERTSEVLRWIKTMKQLPTDEYHKHAFGRIE